MRKLILAGALCAFSFPAMADLVIITETAPPRIEPQGYTGYVERRVQPPMQAPEAMLPAEACGHDIVRKDDGRSAWRPVPGQCG